MASLLIRNGSVVSSERTRRLDVLVEDERVVDMRPEIDSPADREIDATGCLVLPGAIDAHTHPFFADDLGQLSRAAAVGGVTTVLSFIGAFKTWGFEKGSVHDLVAQYISEWDGRPAVDFGLHAAFDSADDVRREVPSLIELGISSFKFFIAYPRSGRMVDDTFLVSAMADIAEAGGTVAVHAENGSGIEHLESRLWNDPGTSDASYLECHTELLESEAVLRVIALADAAGVPLYIPHVAAGDAVEVAVLARKRARVPVWLETCPHYLSLTNDAVLARGALAKIGPPLRHESDQDALWAALGAGGVQVVGTDHAGRTVAMKGEGANILQAPYGAEGIEHLLPLLYGLGVRGGRLSINRMVSVLAENPADIFGLSPRKGRIAVGADADMVILQPEGSQVCRASEHVSAADFCLYEGLELPGAITHTIRRGTIVAEAGSVTPGASGGRYLPRDGLRSRATPVLDELRS